MFSRFVLLSFLLFSSSLFAADIKVLLLKGSSEFVRAGKIDKLDKGTVLKSGDLIKTSKKSFVKIKVAENIISIAPNSYFEISTKANKEEVNVGKLLYGHLQATFRKAANVKRTISTPYASMAIRGTKILLHVTRSVDEYYERAGGTVHALPDLKELKELMNSKATYSQICCIEGKIDVTTSGGKKQSLTEGQVLNYSSVGKNPELNSYSRQAVEGTARRFGFDL